MTFGMEGFPEIETLLNERAPRWSAVLFPLWQQHAISWETDCSGEVGTVNDERFEIRSEATSLAPTIHRSHLTGGFFLSPAIT